MHTHLEITRDVIEVLAVLWVREGQPLMFQDMIFLEVDLGEVDLKVADCVVFEEALV